MPEPTNLAQCRGAGCGGEGRVRAVFPGINQPVSFRAIGEESAFRPHYHGEGRPILAAFLVCAARVGAMRTIEPAPNRILHAPGGSSGVSEVSIRLSGSAASAARSLFWRGVRTGRRVFRFLLTLRMVNVPVEVSAQNQGADLGHRALELRCGPSWPHAAL